MESRNSSAPRMNFSCVSPCMKVKRHAKEYLRTDDDLTEVKVLRFGSLQSSDEQKAKTWRSGGKKERKKKEKKEKALARPLSNPRKHLDVSASGREHVPRWRHDLGRSHETDHFERPVVDQQTNSLRFLPLLDHIHAAATKLVLRVARQSS